MKLRNVALGLASYVPGAFQLLTEGTKGTDTARYCYSVWLRHLVMAYGNGLSRVPGTVAELGPGDSIGIGLAALISGADDYFALDVVNYANLQRNLDIFDELVKLFKTRAGIPGEEEFPDVKPYLSSYEFPGYVLSDEDMKAALDTKRLEGIRQSISTVNQQGSNIRYIVPWFDSGNIKKESVDFIFSQAVLEHVDDLPGTYNALYSWLKSSGLMSHQIDFKCHRMAGEWNGHWTYSDFQWKLVRGARPYLINRAPHSEHVRLIGETGFEVTCDVTVKSPSNIRRRKLAPHFKDLSEDDLTTSGAFIQATK
jgi:hypothetical protein